MAITINGTTGFTFPNGSEGTPSLTGLDSDTGIFFGTDTVSLTTAGTQKLIVDSSGNIGIGSQTPGVKLDILAGSIDRQDLARFRHDGQTDLVIQGQWGSKDIGGSNGTLLYNSLGTIALRSGSSGNAHFVLNSSGDVGFGTVDPVFSNGSGLEISRTGTACIRIEGNNQNHALEAYADSNGATLDARGSSASLMFDIGGSEKVRIDSSGNVGIGTNNPGYKLNVVGAIRSTDGLSISKSSPFYVPISIADSGAGTDEKTWRFQLDRTGKTFSIGAQNDASSAAYSAIAISRVGTQIDDITFYTLNNQERLRIKTGGNVGIGTDNPTQKLHVEGNITLNPTTSHRGLICSTTNFKYYTSLSGSSGQWFTIGTVNDTMTKKYKVVAYAHTMAEFIVQQAFHDERVTLLMAHRAINGGYATIDGIRVTTDSLVQIQLNWSSGPAVSVGVYVESFGIDPGIPWLPNSLVAETKTGSDTVYISSYSARFYSNLRVEGSLSKGSGSFQIDHPLESKKDTHYLVHSFTESPQADLIYRGTIELVDGSASVNIDTEVGMTEGTFEVLCRNVQCFTTNETGWSAVKGTVVGNILNISCQDSTSTDTISWMIVGERQDPHIMECQMTDENGYVIIEPIKPQ